MKECANCGFLNDYGACDCPHSDKWYACPIEAKKPENRKALEGSGRVCRVGRKERRGVTREVAEKIVRGITDKIECNTTDIDDWAEFWGFTREEYEEFLDMAIKALESTDVLDKIRAEMIQMPTISLNANDIYKADVLAIINKYKAESEDNT